jgi:hypothetical protein
MNVIRAIPLFTFITLLSLHSIGKASASEGTTLSISAELATSIATDLFPITISLGKGSVFLTQPQVLFLDGKRVSLRVHLQAYDHRPQENIAISETGWALISGILGYDRISKQILLHDARLDELEFDRSTAATQEMRRRMEASWTAMVPDPIRAEIPAHPYTLLIKDYTQAIFYDGKRIGLNVLYE